jgi:Ca2+-binding EF-hand superfamily protein
MSSEGESGAMLGGVSESVAIEMRDTISMEGDINSGRDSEPVSAAVNAVNVAENLSDKDDKEDNVVIQVKYHLSEIKLIGQHNYRADELEIEHTQAEQDEIRALAVTIFQYWDTIGDGIISKGEMLDSGLTWEFTSALSRALDCDSSGQVQCENLVNCLTILKFGTLKSKVVLLVKFMDRKGDQKLSFDEAETFLTAAPTEICKRLGLLDKHGAAQDLTYEAILSLFENSERGNEAISVFCAHILNTLKSRLPKAALPQRAAQQSCVAGLSLDKIWNRIKHLPTVTLFMAALIALQMALWEFNFSYYQNRGFPTTFCIAKGFGLNLRALTMFLFLTMARTTMGYLHNFRLTRIFIPMGFNIQMHSFCGFCAVFHALGHMLGHIAYHTKNVEGGFSHSFVQKSLLTGASWVNKGSGDAITGYILLTILLIMAVAALCRGASSVAYRYFSLSHFLYVLWMPVLFLHVPHLWPYILPIAIIIVLERSYDFFHQTTHSTLATSRPCDNGVTFLSVPRTKDVGYPGSYYRIKIPAISKSEW